MNIQHYPHWAIASSLSLYTEIKMHRWNFEWSMLHLDFTSCSSHGWHQITLCCVETSQSNFRKFDRIAKVNLVMQSSLLCVSHIPDGDLEIRHNLHTIMTFLFSTLQSCATTGGSVMLFCQYDFFVCEFLKVKLAWRQRWVNPYSFMGRYETGSINSNGARYRFC